YDSTGQYVTSTSVSCNDSIINITLDPCQSYRFVLISSSDKCEYVISDTVYYSGCCPKPEIISYHIVGADLHINYKPHNNYSYCAIKIYDHYYNFLRQEEINCSDTTAVIDKMDGCGLYRFQLVAFSQNCDSLYSN